MDAKNTAEPFERAPLNLSDLGPPCPVSLDDLPNADWQVVALIGEGCGQAWAWALPMLWRGPGERLEPREFASRQTQALPLLAEALTHAIVVQGLSEESALRVFSGSGLRALDRPGHGWARIVLTTIRLEGVESPGEAASVAEWLDQGLRQAMPALAPIQGPFDSADWALFIAGGGRSLFAGSRDIARFEQAKNRVCATAGAMVDWAQGEMIAREIGSQALKGASAKPRRI